MNPHYRNLFEYLGAPTSLTPKDLNTHIRMQAHLTEEERNTSSRTFMNVENKLTSELETCRYKRPLPRTEPTEYKEFCKTVSGSAAEPMPYRFFSAEYKAMFDEFGMDGQAVKHSICGLSDGWRVQAWAAWYLHLAVNAETDDPQMAPILWETAYKLYQQFFAKCKVEESYTYSYQTESEKQELCIRAWDGFLQNQIENIKKRRTQFLNIQNVSAADACLETLKLLDKESYASVMENALLPVIRAIQGADTLSGAMSVYFECSEDIRKTDQNSELKSALLHAMKAELERAGAVFEPVPDVLRCMELLNTFQLAQTADGVLKIDTDSFYQALASYVRVVLNEEKSSVEMTSCACEMVAIGNVTEDLAFDNSGAKRDIVAQLALMLYVKRRASLMRSLSAQEGRAFGEEILAFAKKMGYGKPNGGNILESAVPAAAVILREIVDEKAALLNFIGVFDKNMKISDTGLPTIRKLYDYYDKEYVFTTVDNRARQDLKEEWKQLGQEFDGTVEQEEAVIRLITAVYENRHDSELLSFALKTLAVVYAANVKIYTHDVTCAVSRRIMAQIAAFRKGSIPYGKTTATKHENGVDAERSLLELIKLKENTNLAGIASEEFKLALRKLLYYYRRCQDFPLVFASSAGSSVNFKMAVQNFIFNAVTNFFESANITIDFIKTMLDFPELLRKTLSINPQSGLNYLINAGCLVFSSETPQYKFLFALRMDCFLPSWVPDSQYSAKIVFVQRQRGEQVKNFFNKFIKMKPKRKLEPEPEQKSEPEPEPERKLSSAKNQAEAATGKQNLFKQVKRFAADHKKGVLFGAGGLFIVLLAVVIISCVAGQTNSWAKKEIKEIRKAHVGDTVLFGGYKTNDDVDSFELIEWIVLEKKDDKALILSKYALDCEPYDMEYESTWEKCTLRGWLNEEFLNRAFSDDEQILICNQPVLSGSENGIDYHTRDRVFLLSKEEALRYFEYYTERECLQADYVENKLKSFSAEDDLYCSWWLRPVEESGAIEYIQEDGTFTYGLPDLSFVAVRPAIWVNLSKDPEPDTENETTTAAQEEEFVGLFDYLDEQDAEDGAASESVHKFSGKADFEDEDLIFYVPQGMHEDTAWLSDYFGLEVWRGYTNRSSDAEEFSHGICYIFSNKSDLDAYNEVSDKNNDELYLSVAVRDEIDLIKESDDFVNSIISEPYEMLIGSQMWLCLDISFTDNDSVQTRAFSLHGEYVNVLFSFADEGGVSKTREQLRQNIDTKW